VPDRERGCVRLISMIGIDSHPSDHPGMARSDLPDKRGFGVLA